MSESRHLIKTLRKIVRKRIPKLETDERRKN